MTELRNVEADLAQFRTRVLVAGLAVVFAFGLLAARMVYLQVMRHEDLDAQAESNRTAVLPVVPNRGQILDRYGRILATNFSAYTLEITPSKVEDWSTSSLATSGVFASCWKSRAASTRCRSAPA